MGGWSFSLIINTLVAGLSHVKERNMSIIMVSKRLVFCKYTRYLHLVNRVATTILTFAFGLTF